MTTTLVLAHLDTSTTIQTGCIQRCPAMLVMWMRRCVVLTTEEVCCVGSVRMAMVLLFIHLTRHVSIVQVSVQDMPFSISVSSVPTTLIFLFFVVFRFNITSGPLLGYVLLQTTIAAITYRQFFIHDHILYNVSSSLRVLLDLSLTVSQFWSLHFLKAIIPPFCVSEKLTGIHVNILSTSHLSISSCHHLPYSH